MKLKKTFLLALIFALLITLALPAAMGGMSSQVGQNLPASAISIHPFQMSAVDLARHIHTVAVVVSQSANIAVYVQMFPGTHSPKAGG